MRLIYQLFAMRCIFRFEDLQRHLLSKRMAVSIGLGAFFIITSCSLSTYRYFRCLLRTKRHCFIRCVIYIRKLLIQLITFIDDVAMRTDFGLGSIWNAWFEFRKEKRMSMAMHEFQYNLEANLMSFIVLTVYYKHGPYSLCGLR